MVEREAVPKDDPNLGALTKAWRRATAEFYARRSRVFAPQLLAYAVGVKSMLLENLPQVTLSRDIVEKFYPLLADLILEVRFACVNEPSARHLTARLFPGPATRQRRRSRGAKLRRSLRSCFTCTVVASS